ncbi:hypothetical protein V6N12_062658 [Hibiscus sabdariffa]|uniref:Uncharacterized protein n=1 Tax=Hibiscus sabdariffa TaxID=183260 RepID=A0ABR2F9G7_9ROSI
MSLTIPHQSLAFEAQAQLPTDPQRFNITGGLLCSSFLRQVSIIPSKPSHPPLLFLPFFSRLPSLPSLTSQASLHLKTQSNSTNVKSNISRSWNPR